MALGRQDHGRNRYTREMALEAIASSEDDAFGYTFIANPNLVMRLKKISRSSRPRHPARARQAK
jgi:hypothetical protein